MSSITSNFPCGILEHFAILKTNRRCSSFLSIATTKHLDLKKKGIIRRVGLIWPTIPGSGLSLRGSHGKSLSNQSHHIHSQRRERINAWPCLLLIFSWTVKFKIPYVGNGATHRRLYHPFSIRNQDNPLLTSLQNSLMKKVTQFRLSSWASLICVKLTFKANHHRTKETFPQDREQVSYRRGIWTGVV